MGYTTTLHIVDAYDASLLATNPADIGGDGLLTKVRSILSIGELQADEIAYKRSTSVARVNIGKTEGAMADLIETRIREAHDATVRTATYVASGDALAGLDGYGDPPALLDLEEVTEVLEDDGYFPPVTAALGMLNAFPNTGQWRVLAYGS